MPVSYRVYIQCSGSFLGGGWGGKIFVVFVVESLSTKLILKRPLPAVVQAATTKIISTILLNHEYFVP